MVNAYPGELCKTLYGAKLRWIFNKCKKTPKYFSVRIFLI